MTECQPPTNNTGDELVLDWWEAYDGGWSIGMIADQWAVPVRLVHAALSQLGVLDPKRIGIGSGAAERVVPDLVDEVYVKSVLERAAHGGLSSSEVGIMAALRRLCPDAEGDSESRRHLPFASSLPHIKPTRGHRVPMSSRQRMNDALGTGRWAKVVRGDLKRAGLIP